MRQGTTDRTPGFTLIELVIVVAVISILAGVLVPAATAIMNKSKASSAFRSIKGVVDAGIQLNSDTGRWPHRPCGPPRYDPDGSQDFLNQPRAGLIDTDGGYSGWKGPYFATRLSPDPWSNNYRYDNETDSIPGAASYGSDGPNRTCECYVNRRDMVIPGDDIAIYMNMRCGD